MKTVKILSGISGSGKTTLAMDLVHRHIAEVRRDRDKRMSLPAYRADEPEILATAVVESADTYFLDFNGKYNFDASKLSEAHGECFKGFIEALQNNVQFVVVDNTNTTTEELAPYILGAQAYGYDAEVITVLCDPVIACERNRHGVPYASILAQAERIKTRRLPPWWKARTA